MKTIISIILIAASIAFFVFFTKPKLAELKENRVEVEKMRIAQDNAKKLKSRIETLLNEKNSISEADLEKMKKMLPDNVENVKLIIDFDNLLQDLVTQKGTLNLYTSAGLSETGKVSIENPKITPTTTLIDGRFDSSQLGAADFSFTVSLTYGDFLDLLKRIETSTRIFDIESISFSTPKVERNENPNDIIYDFNITLKTYWLKSK